MPRLSSLFALVLAAAIPWRASAQEADPATPFDVPEAPTAPQEPFEGSLGSSVATQDDSFVLDNRADLTTDLLDPVVQLRRIRQRREIIARSPDSLFKTSPLTPLREQLLDYEKQLYEATNLRLGTTGNHLLQGLSDENDGRDDFGMSSFLLFIATWDGYHKGCPDQGEVTMSLEGRWNYGPPDPVTLGAQGLNSTLFTANPFTTYTPTFLVRNLFWRQGSREAGWRYRIGRVTPDQFFGSSRHMTPLDTFLPIGTGSFAIALPDTGLGGIGGFYVNDRVNIVAGLHDANADRTDFDVGNGELFTALELQVKLFPLTENAGYSKVTLWHNDGTSTGQAINGSTGAEGWGVFFKLEQELTCDGRMVAIGRWGRSEKDSAVYEKLAGGHVVYYDPFDSGRYERMGFEADVVGVGSTWGQQTGALREETDINVFYRFPILPEVDATIHYQTIFNPGLSPNNDFGSAVSLRLRSTW